MKTENLRLQRKIANFEAKNVSFNNKITILEEYKKAHPDIYSMTDDELLKELEISKNELADEELQEIARGNISSHKA